MDKYSENYLEKIMEYTEKEKNEIRNDRKILDMILEKYGKDDVMQFLNTDFDGNDDNQNYFDSFSQRDNIEKRMYDTIGTEAAKMKPRVQTLIDNIYEDSAGKYLPITTQKFISEMNYIISFLVNGVYKFFNENDTVMMETDFNSLRELIFWLAASWTVILVENDGYKDFPERIPDNWGDEDEYLDENGLPYE